MGSLSILFLVAFQNGEQPFVGATSPIGLSKYRVHPARRKRLLQIGNVAAVLLAEWDSRNREEGLALRSQGRPVT
jgi:hypothetical protein